MTVKLPHIASLEDWLKLARETDVWCDQYCRGDENNDARWEEKFAELVATAERNRCADILDRLHERAAGNHNYYAFAARIIRELGSKV